MRLLVLNLWLLISIAVASANGRQKRDLSKVKNWFSSAIFGRRHINIQPPRYGTDTTNKLYRYRVPGYNDILIKVVPRTPTVNEYVYSQVNPINLNSYKAIVDTKYHNDKPIAEKEIHNFISPGNSNGNPNNVTKNSSDFMSPAHAVNKVTAEKMKIVPKIETKPLLANGIQPYAERVQLQLPFNNNQTALPHNGHFNRKPEVNLVNEKERRSELPMCIKQRIDDVVTLGTNPYGHPPLQEVYQHQPPPLMDLSYPKQETNSYIHNPAYGGVNKRPVPDLRLSLQPFKDIPVSYNLRPMKSQLINLRPLPINTHIHLHLDVVGNSAAKNNNTPQTTEAHSSNYSGDKVKMSPTSGSHPAQYMAHTSNGLPEISKEKDAVRMNNTQIVALNDSTANVNIPSYVYKYQSNPNTGKMHKVEDAPKTNMKPNGNYYVLPAVNSEVPKMPDAKVNNGINPYEEVTNPLNGTRSDSISRKNLPKDIVVDINASKTNNTQQTTVAQPSIYSGNKVTMSPTSEPDQVKYIALPSKGLPEISKEKDAVRMNNTQIVALNDSTANVNIPSYVYKYQSNPNTGEMHKVEEAPKTNVKPNGNNYVLPAVNSRGLEMQDTQVNNGINPYEEVTNPPSVTSSVNVSTTNLPKDIVVNINASKTNNNLKSNETRAFTYSGDKVKMSPTSGHHPTQYMAHPSKEHPEILKEKDAVGMNNTQIVTLNDSIANVNVPSYVYKYQSNPNTGKMHKVEEAPKTNVKPNGNYYVLPAVNSRGLEMQDTKVNNGINPYEEVTNPPSVTRSVTVSTTNLPQDIVVDINASKTNNTQQTTEAQPSTYLGNKVTMSPTSEPDQAQYIAHPSKGLPETLNEKDTVRMNNTRIVALNDSTANVNIPSYVYKYQSNPNTGEMHKVEEAPKTNVKPNGNNYVLPAVNSRGLEMQDTKVNNGINPYEEVTNPPSVTSSVTVSTTNLPKDIVVNINASKTNNNLKSNETRASTYSGDKVKMSPTSGHHPTQYMAQPSKELPEILKEKDAVGMNNTQIVTLNDSIANVNVPSYVYKYQSNPNTGEMHKVEEAPKTNVKPNGNNYVLHAVNSRGLEMQDTKVNNGMNPYEEVTNPPSVTRSVTVSTTNLPKDIVVDINASKTNNTQQTTEAQPSTYLGNKVTMSPTSEPDQAQYMAHPSKGLPETLKEKDTVGMNNTQIVASNDSTANVSIPSYVSKYQSNPNTGKMHKVEEAPKTNVKPNGNNYVLPAVNSKVLEMQDAKVNNGMNPYEEVTNPPSVTSSVTVSTTNLPKDIVVDINASKTNNNLQSNETRASTYSGDKVKMSPTSGPHPTQYRAQPSKELPDILREKDAVRMNNTQIVTLNDSIANVNVPSYVYKYQSNPNTGEMHKVEEASKTNVKPNGNYYVLPAVNSRGLEMQDTKVNNGINPYEEVTNPPIVTSSVTISTTNLPKDIPLEINKLTSYKDNSTVLPVGRGYSHRQTNADGPPMTLRGGKNGVFDEVKSRGDIPEQ